MKEQQQDEKIVNDLMMGVVTKQDEIILDIMMKAGLEGVDMKNIVRHIGANGTEDWKYNNKTFARVFPFTITQEVKGKTTVIKATQVIQNLYSPIKL